MPKEYYPDGYSEDDMMRSLDTGEDSFVCDCGYQHWFDPKKTEIITCECGRTIDTKEDRDARQKAQDEAYRE